MAHTIPTPHALGNIFSNGPTPAAALTSLASQNRLLELSRFGLRGYDLAQHFLTQQNAVSKLLGKFLYHISKHISLIVINLLYNMSKVVYNF